MNTVPAHQSLAYLSGKRFLAQKYLDEAQARFEALLLQKPSRERDDARAEFRRCQGYLADIDQAMEALEIERLYQEPQQSHEKQKEGAHPLP